MSETEKPKDTWDKFSALGAISIRAARCRHRLLFYMELQPATVSP